MTNPISSHQDPHSTHSGIPRWTCIIPAAAIVLSGIEEFVLGGSLPPVLLFIAVILLFLTVFSAVYFAEMVALKIGQPFGSVLLAVAVTIIEVSLIISVLLQSPSGESEVARDTVFASIMIALNGIVGLCLVIGGIRYHTQGFQARSAAAALGVLGTVAVLGLVLPNFTLAIPGPVYAPTQLVFVAVVSFALYALFLFTQMVSHRDDFLDELEGAVHAAPSKKGFIISLFMLPVALLGVVMLAEGLAHPLEVAIDRSGLPHALVGVVIALVVLMPEGIAAIRAVLANRLQSSLNVALGSALASICLTIPVISMITLVRGDTLVLGLDSEHIVLLVLSLFMATISLTTGRTTVLQGGIHLVIFGAYLTIAAIP
jgi:Ca2+:H+ antiporter